MNMHSTLDQQILREIAKAIKASNKEAFDLFFKAEYENIKYFINYYVLNLPAAEDLAQDTFVALWDNRENIDLTQNIRSYIFKIAKNRSLNYLGTQRNRKTNSLELYEISLSIEALSDEYTISKIDSLSAKRIIDLTYEKLPDLTRKVFIMSREENMTYEEIAKQLEMPVKKVEYNISKALKIFTKKLSLFR